MMPLAIFVGTFNSNANCMTISDYSTKPIHWDLAITRGHMKLHGFT